ncbi:FliH/SctL family protein [Anaerovorax sp. IOR16]|uniref:FliH/SctL family protein n=1 Tax=Anaerovorax sp. IOR16 TaxID=2773458 RepID=UPI0019D1E260|nr:FliH/SctL family protein [Anaerovorax sp. IOR16]
MKAWLEEASMNVPQEIIEQARQEADEIMRKAAMDASEVMNAGRQRAVELQEEAKTQGYQAGYDIGKNEAIKKVEDEYKNQLSQEYSSFLESMYTASMQIEEKKKEMQIQYLKQMKEMVLTIAEKVINVSLKSSAEVIERMILFALETSGSYQWAKVRISAEDAKRMQEVGVDLESALKHVAERVKIVVIEDAPSGTCYVEFPDQIIDASAQTQLQNIRTLIET